ncbi:MAG TPA: FAD-dependent oxidoreductase [Clostridia bacterium]|nr:FAD-dependent oxidoreductase [Clostridia bacterium]
MIDTDILVVGAGPAGLSAAAEAARHGARVTVVDENEKPGGQLFKQIHKFFGSRRHRAGVRGFDIGYALLDEVKSLGVEVMLDTVCYGIFPEGVGLVVSGKRDVLVEPRRIVLATGASENPLCFPGWTLPGVVGAGAVQTMINVHRVPVGERVLMVGSGNVGLIVSYQLLQSGAQVVGIVEALPKVGGYGVHAAKVRRAGVPIYTSHTVVSALPNSDNTRVKAAVIARLDENMSPIPGTEKELDVDTIAIAVGLTPMTELAFIAGAAFTYSGLLGGHIPLHDEDLMTTVEGLYVAGDVSGVEEASTALEEGRLAGVAAAASLGKIPEVEAEEKKREIRESLRDLRTGPFGDARARAKEEIVNEMAKRRGKRSA